MPPETLTERIAQVQSAREAGEPGNALVERLSAALNPPAPAPAPPAAGEPPPEPPAEPTEETVDPKILELLERPPAERGKPGDPAGSYRDEVGRLRREDNDALLPEPEVPAHAAQVTTETEGALPPKSAEEQVLRPVKLPGREGAADYEFKPTNAEEAQRIRMLVNSYSSRAALEQERARIAESAGELDSRVRLIQHDPVGFILEQLDSGDQAGIAQRILAALPAAEFAKVLELANAWKADALARENVQLHTENESQKRRDQFQKEENARRNKQDAVNKIVTKVYELVPDTMDDREADRFYRVALADLEAYLSVPGNRGTLSPDRVHAVLKEAGTLEMFGLGVEDDAEPAPKPKSAKKPAPAPPAQVQRAKEAGPQFRKRTETRKAAAALTPAGAGAAAATVPQPPPGQTVKERANWAKKLFGR